MSLLQLKWSQLFTNIFYLKWFIISISCCVLYPVWKHYYVLLCHVIGQQNTLVFVTIVYLYITNQHSPTHLKTSWEWPNNGKELAYPTPQNHRHLLGTSRQLGELILNILYISHFMSTRNQYDIGQQGALLKFSLRHVATLGSFP